MNQRFGITPALLTGSQTCGIGAVDDPDVHLARVERVAFGERIVRGKCF